MTTQPDWRRSTKTTNETGVRTVLKRCEFGVSDAQHGSEDCGEPAVATWDWGHGPFYVCEEHDAVIYEQEDGEST